MVTWHLNEQPSQDSVHQLKNFVIKKKKKKKGFGSVAHLWHTQQGPAQALQHNQLHVVGEGARKEKVKHHRVSIWGILRSVMIMKL